MAVGTGVGVTIAFVEELSVGVGLTVAVTVAGSGVGRWVTVGDRPTVGSSTSLVSQETEASIAIVRMATTDTRAPVLATTLRNIGEAAIFNMMTPYQSEWG